MNRTGPILAVPALALFILIFAFWQTGNDLVLGLPTSVVALTGMIFLCLGFALLYTYLRGREGTNKERAR